MTEPQLTAAAMTADDESVVILPARVWDALFEKAYNTKALTSVNMLWAERGLQNFMLWTGPDHWYPSITLIRGES